MDLTKKILEQQYVTKEDFNELGNKALDGDSRALEQLRIAANRNPDAQAILDAVYGQSPKLKRIENDALGALRHYNTQYAGKGLYKAYDEKIALPYLRALRKKHPLIDEELLLKILKGTSPTSTPFIPGRVDMTDPLDRRIIRGAFMGYLRDRDIMDFFHDRIPDTKIPDWAYPLSDMIKSGVPSPRGGFIKGPIGSAKQVGADSSASIDPRAALKFIRESNVKLTKSKLQQLIKEELKKITKPPQRAEAWLDVVGSVFFGDVDGEGADPCLKDPAAKQLIKTQMMELKNLNPEELDYIANKSADLIESFESELIGDADELLAAAGEGTGAGYEYDQQILKMAEKYKCMVKVLKTIFDKASEISAAKSQVQSDKQKALGKRGGGEITIYDKQGKAVRRLGIDRDDKMFQITRESNTKLTKSKLEQLIKEAIENITEADIKVEYPYLDAFNAYKKEIDLKLKDPNLTKREIAIVKLDKIKFIEDIEEKFSIARARTDAQKNAYLKKEYSNHPAYKDGALKGVPTILQTIAVDTRGGPDKIPDTDAEIEARYKRIKRILDKSKKR